MNDIVVAFFSVGFPRCFLMMMGDYYCGDGGGCGCGGWMRAVWSYVFFLIIIIIILGIGGERGGRRGEWEEEEEEGHHREKRECGCGCERCSSVQGRRC